MKILFRYLPAQRKPILTALLLAAVNQVFLMADPYIFRRIVDDFVLRYRDLAPMQLLSGAGFWVGMMMLSVLFAWGGKNLLLGRVSQASHRISSAMFADGIRHSLELPYLEFEQRRSGEIVDRLQRLRSTVERFLFTSINLAFASAVRVLLVIVYAATIDWALGAFLVVVAPLLAIGSLVLSRRIGEVERQLVEENAAHAGSATETLRNIEVVKSLGLAGQEIARLNESTDRILNVELERSRRVRLLTFYHGAAVHAGRGLLLILSMYLLFRNHLTIGQFLSLYLYSSFLFVPLQELSEVAAEYRETEAAMESFRDLLSAPVESRPADCVEVQRIETVEFDHVDFRYPSADHPAVTGLCFRASRGEIIAFVGPSGAGKTTLIKLISGLYSPSSGNVLYNEIPLARMDVNAIRRRIGLVTQETQLFAGTLRDNLLFANPDATDAECKLALEKAAASGLLTKGRQGLDTRIGEGGMRLSGGERQRLAIARALLRRPELLIFDEATSSLDSITEKEISATIRQAASDTHAITVLIAHRLSTVRDAHRIYILDHGEIVECGNHEELMRREGLYRDLWRQQGA